MIIQHFAKVTAAGCAPAILILSKEGEKRSNSHYGRQARIPSKNTQCAVEGFCLNIQYRTRNVQ